MKLVVDLLQMDEELLTVLHREVEVLDDDLLHPLIIEVNPWRLDPEARK